MNTDTQRRSGRTWFRFEQLGRNARYALRQIRRNPDFSTIAIATLALGIGANTAMFSAVDAVVIRPLPYADADRLVMVWDDSARTGEPKFYSTPPEWYEWRRQNTVFTDIAATQPGEAALSSDDGPEQLPARKVTPNFWSVLGAPPQLGRSFTEDEDARGAKVVVISDGLWQRRFGRSPGVLGHIITLNDTPYEIIGVMPRGFSFLPARDIDIWMPTSFSTTRGSHDRLRRPRAPRVAHRADGGAAARVRRGSGLGASVILRGNRAISDG